MTTFIHLGVFITHSSARDVAGRVGGPRAWLSSRSASRSTLARPPFPGTMGKKRFERVANSTRPAAKLGGGGGWNIDGARGIVDGDPASLPAYPTPLSRRRVADEGRVDLTAAASDAHERTRAGDEGETNASSSAAAAGASASASALPPRVYKKVFSGMGWRAAAPGFGNPEDKRDDAPRRPRILVGNLPTDVDPGELVDIIEAHCESLDYDGELTRTQMAVFGPARPKLKRDRGRLHRGFALLTFDTVAAALSCAALLDGADLRTPSKKTEGGLRPMKCTTEVGDAMDDRFMDGTQGEDAPPPPPPPVPDDPSAAPFSLSELRRFPMRSNCLSTHATLADLDPTLRDRLARYFRDACEGLPEFASVFARAERLAGKYTRVKEIVESVEAFKVVVSFVATCERTGARQVRKFFDLACGHGLVGIMLAYAYPDRTVMACDRKRRESFEAFAEAFAHYASREENSPATFHDDEVEPEVEPGAAGSSRRSRRLPNLTFVEGELDVLAPNVDSNSLVLALHGCNEANKDSMRMATSASALWCVMPCCIRANLYLPNCTVSKMTDDQRYAFMCGVMACEYGAQMARCIDRRITNRAVVLCGGCEDGDEEEGDKADGDGEGGGSVGPFGTSTKLRFYSDHKHLVTRARRRKDGESAVAFVSNPSSR